MVTIRTVWITRRAGEKPVFSAYPPPPRDAAEEGRVVYLTNDVAAFEDLAPEKCTDIADVMAVRAFAFPDTPLEHAAQMFTDAAPSAEALYGAWQQFEKRLAAFPLWALETIELLLRDLGEKALAHLFGALADRVRQSGRNCGNWVDAFAAENLRVERKHTPTHADCSPLAPERVAAHLLPNGIFARLMPGYEPRLGQVAMLRAVARAFNEGKHLLVEAGTGVGKSLAYLIPAAAWARLNDIPVIVSTNTRNLQSQLIEKDLPLVREAIRAEFGEDDSQRLRVAVLKGRSNYLCLRQLAVLLEYSQFELDRPELRLFTEAVAWAVRTPDGDLDAFAGAGRASAAFLAKLASVGEECQGRACRYFRRCFLQKARARALAAHVVIANHALVFSDLQVDGGMLPPYAQIVFDEAHNLEETATRHLSVEFTPQGLSQALNRLSRPRAKRGGGILETLRNHLEKGAVTADSDIAETLRERLRAARRAVEDIRTDARVLFERMGQLLAGGRNAVRYRCETAAFSPAMLVGDAKAPPLKRLVFRSNAFMPADDLLDEADVAVCREALRTSLQAATECLTQLADLLRRAAAGELALYGDQAASIEGAVATLKGFAAAMHFVLDAQDPESVFWSEPAGRYWPGQASLTAAPLNISHALAERLYAKKTSVVFCSATLRVGGSFNYIGRRLGIDLIEAERLITCVAESPFDYRKQCAALALTCLPEPTGADGGSYVEQLSGLMLDVFLKTRGRALGLFTSYEMMNSVGRLLEAPLGEAGIRLLLHGASGTRDQITRVFRSADCPSVLLGTHSFWEGVDVVGEALSCVVMARLPFTAVGDPIFEARCEQIEQSGGSSFRELSVPQAVIRFRQGFGRLIRTCTDRGIVIIADPRLITRGYGATFCRSLPSPVQPTPDRAALLAAVDAFFGG
ncbi:MAG: hypothetical protein FWG50_02405 [Kiritimatiellaeota bacterium]|nr:hypothetical protein [Kiritimatiellota bacterium]